MKKIYKINISSTFIARTKCKFCLTGPTYTYSSRAMCAYRDHQYFLKSVNTFRKYCERFGDDFYVYDSVRDITSIAMFGHQPNYKSYSPRYHKNKSKDFISFVHKAYCNCGRSTWAYYYDKSKDPLEIIHRKGRYKYPYKFYED